MDVLTPGLRRALRARAHALHPVVSISQNGLSPAVLKEIDSSLKAHELIKIRIYGEDKAQRGALLQEICLQLSAFAVQHIGNILVVFRENPDRSEPQPQPEATPPARRRRR